MGLYIKDLKMPKEYPIRIVIYPNGRVIKANAVEYEEFEGVPISPHGRLIDAEPIMKFITDGLNSGKFGYDAIEVLTEIKYATTIIETEALK